MPEDRPTTTPKTPHPSAKPGKGEAREARLAQALRDNLRRRKAGGVKAEDKEPDVGGGENKDG